MVCAYKKAPVCKIWVRPIATGPLWVCYCFEYVASCVFICNLMQQWVCCRLRMGVLCITICVFLRLLNLFCCSFIYMQGCRLFTCGMMLVIPVLPSLAWCYNLVCNVVTVTKAACHIVHHFMFATESGFVFFLLVL